LFGRTRLGHCPAGLREDGDHFMRLHLGCGPVRLDGWTNIDLDSPVADLQHDLRQPLPFADGSVDAIFCEHFIEHVTREEAVQFLSRCRRLLKPGAPIRVTTPDLHWIIAMYLGRQVDHWSDVQWSPDTPCRLINESMRLWGHQWVYDREDLHALFAEAGFGDRRDAVYRRSSFPFLAGLESRPYHHELILDAVQGDGAPQPIAAPAPVAVQPHPDLASLQREIAHLRETLEAIQASSSWRVTAPIRGLLHLLRGKRAPA
jgi:predicted SAM-dependent methyltransferase